MSLGMTSCRVTGGDKMKQHVLLMSAGY